MIFLNALHSEPTTHTIKHSYTHTHNGVFPFGRVPACLFSLSNLITFHSHGAQVKDAFYYQPLVRNNHGRSICEKRGIPAYHVSHSTYYIYVLHISNQLRWWMRAVVSFLLHKHRRIFQIFARNGRRSCIILSRKKTCC